jgi:hypothetical protein
MRSRTSFLAALLVVAAHAPAHAGVFESMRGSAGLGYSKVFVEDAPAGSFSVAAGLDFPAFADLRWGGSVALDILGSRSITRGSLAANIDYSAFEAALLLHWSPKNWGPVGRVSFGPALMSTRAELSTSGGGAAFRDLAVEEVVPAAALGVTLHSSKPRPVQVGLEIAGRYAFLEDDDWFLTSVRLALLY